MAPAGRKRRAQPDIHDDEAYPAQRRRTQDGSSAGDGGRRSSTKRAKRGSKNPVTLETSDDEWRAMEAEGKAGREPEKVSTKVVRLALKQEYLRVPIKKQDVTKILPNPRQFKEVFAKAQAEFKHAFGIEMTELPARDRIVPSQRRKGGGGRNEKEENNGEMAAPHAPSGSYTLTSILPTKLRIPEIMEPHGFKEQTYYGFVNVVIAILYLSGRSLSDHRLMRHLRRFSADESMPLGPTEKVLQTMVKHGYLLRIKDITGDETNWEYHLGPRAKVEIGEEGVKNLFEGIYKEEMPDNFEEKLKATMGVEIKTHFSDETLNIERLKQAPQLSHFEIPDQM